MEVIKQKGDYFRRGGCSNLCYAGEYYRKVHVNMGTNPTSFQELAQDVFSLLKKYDIEAQSFSLQILVPKEYYESIKEDFPSRSGLDFALAVAERNWAIMMHYSILMKLDKED